ncbi:MAG: YncE family protein [Vicinamibacteria bacterium]|nr:YncE family protein [Vicinamibacteria bacterium]
MTTLHRGLASAALAATLFWSVPVTHAGDDLYTFKKDIAVGGEGGWDYLSVDAAARRLYVTHATKVVVIDLDTDAVVAEVTDTPGVHGFAIAPDLSRGFSSNGRESKASIFDLKTLKLIMKVDTGANPDSILYEPSRKEVYTFNGRGQSATVFDATSGAVVATIPLDGKPEFAQVDAKLGRIYVNIEDKNVIRAIDIKTHTVVASWPLTPGEEPTGLAFDPVTRRLFSTCDKVLVVLDPDSGKVVTTLPTGSGVDAVAFDPGTRNVFASGSDSTVTIAHIDSADKLTLVQTLKSPARARTMTLDPKTHNLYLAAATFEPGPPAAAGAPPSRPQMVPGTFHVAVFSMKGPS